MKAKARSKTKSKSKSKSKASKVNAQFAAIHRKLEAILRKYERGGLKNRPDTLGGFCLVGPETATSRGREVWFGAVGPRKSYVSYHLMPVYMFPDLLEDTSPELKKRMQGKSCFNFKQVDDTLFAELARLTESSFKRFKAEKLIR